MRWLIIPLLLALAPPGRTAAAEEPAGLIPGYTVDTLLSAGYRFVDIQGSRDKYREDYNLGEGPRLFDFSADGRALAPAESPVDRFHLEVVTPGNEPVQQYSLSASDRERFDLRARFTRSKYFYAVPQLWTDPVASVVRTDDLHDWNFVRTNGTVDLTIRAPHLPTLLLGYGLVERDGSAVSTVLVPAGDTFLLNAPVHDIAHTGRIGTEFSLAGTDLFLQQEYRWLDRDRPLNYPLDPAGLDPTDGVRLDTADRHQQEHLGMPATTLRAHRLLGDRAEFDAGYYYSHSNLDTDQTAHEVVTVTPAAPATTIASGHGSATLDTHVADAGLLVGITEHVRVRGDYRYNERSQHGDLTETGTLGALDARTGDQIRIHRVTTTIEYTPQPTLSLAAGGRWSLRDVNFPAQLLRQTTDTFGAVASARWRPTPYLDLSGRYENMQIDDPIATPGAPNAVPPLPAREITLTYRNRGTLGVGLRPWEWLTLRYQLVADHRSNDTFHGVTESFANSAFATATPIDGLTVMLGYTRRDLSSRADILIQPLPTATTSVQQGSEDIVQSTLDYEFGLFGQRWRAGWNVAYVRSDNVLRPVLETGGGYQTRYDLDRVDGGVSLAWLHRVIEPSVEFRIIDYAEPTLDRNDYRATIVTVRLTKRWTF